MVTMMLLPPFGLPCVAASSPMSEWLLCGPMQCHPSSVWLT